MTTQESPSIVSQVTRIYATLILTSFSFFPAFGIAYLYFFQNPDLKFVTHLGHEIAISIALLQSGFIAWISWLCFQYSGEKFLRWLAVGFLGFTLVYACHGAFTRFSADNIWQFVLYGPASRLAMACCFLFGLLNYARPAVAAEDRAGLRSIIPWVAIFAAINVLVFILANTPWAPKAQRILEIISLSVTLLCAAIVLIKGIRSPLLSIFMVSLLFFAQSSAAFLLSSAWNHIWWFAHIIFATGFIFLSYGVIQAFLTTRSFATVFSQEQLMEQIHIEKSRVEEALSNLEVSNQELEDTNDLLKAVLKSASEFAIIATDSKGIIRVFNAGAEHMLGYKAAELINHKTPAILHLEEEVAARSAELSLEYGHPIEGFRVFVEKSELEGRETREWTYIHKDGHKIPISMVVTTMRDQYGAITGYLGIAENITERKRIAQMKNEFISTVSHELRTPLTAIAGALGMASSGALGTPPEQMTMVLDVAQRNSQRLALLINDLLDFEKITAGKLSFDMQWQELDPIIEQSLENNLAYGSERNIKLVLHQQTKNLRVLVDAQRLQQVMANLLSNAIKFSNEGSDVEITVRKQDHRARVEVLDHGMGIADKFHDTIFERFSQADSSDTRQKGGSGLGLAISRELIDHMHGKIGFESIEGEGTTFWFKIPLQAEN
ncbi:MAG: ATP-binding protein [Spongiibacteraceae bacterium]